MSPRGRNFGLRKVCDCGRSRWAKCVHAWNFNFKPRGGPPYRFSLDAELGRHISSKTEAEHEATRIKAAILAGTFRRVASVPISELAGLSVTTLDQFAAIYVERVSKASGKASWRDDEHLLSKVRGHRCADGRRLGELPLASITEDEIEAFYTALQAAGRAASTRNHYVQLVKAAFRWASKKGYVGRSPISEDSALKRSKVTQRRRRLLPDEETLLLVSAGEVTRGAGLRLQWLIIAALESGCGLGELLGLQWADLNLSKRTLLVRAVEEGARKTSQPRQLPVSARLAAVFEMARLDPTGQPYPLTAYVFGQLGRRVRSIKKAWESCVLRAHGYTPTWSKRGHKLSEEARTALRGVDLHFHDLRHEAGCRWLEAGWPIHHVQEMLGHSNLSQTSTYLHANEMGLQESMKKFDDARCTSVADSPAIEQRPLGKTEGYKPSKDLLH